MNKTTTKIALCLNTGAIDGFYFAVTESYMIDLCERLNSYYPEKNCNFVSVVILNPKKNETYNDKLFHRIKLEG